MTPTGKLTTIHAKIQYIIPPFLPYWTNSTVNILGVTASVLATVNCNVIATLAVVSIEDVYGSRM
jgi:hypothetical protein